MTAEFGVTASGSREWGTTGMTRHLTAVGTAPRSRPGVTSKLAIRLAGPALATLLLALPQPALSETLTDALIAAYRNSEQLKSEQAALRATDEGVAQAVSKRRPSLAASLSGTATETWPTRTTTQTASLKLASELTVWDGGETELAAEAALMSVKAAREGLILTEQQVLLDAVTAYMDMRRDERALELAENNMRVLERQVRATRDRFEVGAARRTDVSLAEARLAAAQSQVAARQGQLEISREAFFVAVGRYPGKLQDPPPPPAIPDTLERARAIALSRHPAVRRAQHLAKLAEINLARAEAAMKPNVKLTGTLSVSPGSSLIGADNAASLSLSASMPIYQGGALMSALRQARANLDKARHDIQLTGKQVGQGVTLAWSRLQIARASIIARQKEVRASRVALKGIREEESLGARTTLDVLNAERDLLQAQTDLVTARRDEYVAVYSLLSAMGLLTVKHLGLGIRTYDPDRNYNRVSAAPPATPSERGRILDRILTRAGKKHLRSTK